MSRERVRPINSSPGFASFIPVSQALRVTSSEFSFKSNISLAVNIPSYSLIPEDNGSISLNSP